MARIFLRSSRVHEIKPDRKSLNLEVHFADPLVTVIEEIPKPPKKPSKHPSKYSSKHSEHSKHSSKSASKSSSITNASSSSINYFDVVERGRKLSAPADMATPNLPAPTIYLEESAIPVINNANTTVDGYYYVFDKYQFRRMMARYHRHREECERASEDHQTTIGVSHSLIPCLASAPDLEEIPEEEEPEEIVREPWVPPVFVRHDEEHEDEELEGLTPQLCLDPVINHQVYIVDAAAVSVSSIGSLVASSLHTIEGNYVGFYDCIVLFFRHGFRAIFGQHNQPLDE
ncbi:hypothetical protein Sste5346_004712 [Sporothrix stenoceras]|uniref:Uncharacterized protein n=1 Tax=Sporothrix stenoceras TaxID=5173 RepID=A0ABR3Z6X5_9PEZI